MATILALLPLPEEHDRFIEFFPALGVIDDTNLLVVEHQIDIADFRFYSVLSSGMGLDNAFDAVQAAIELTEPNLIVCLGIAGALTDDLKIGDVAVSGEIIDISQNIKVSEVPLRRKRRSNQKPKKNTTTPTRTVIELSPKNFPIATELSASFRFLRSHPVLKFDLANWTSQAKARREALIGESIKDSQTEEFEKDPVAEIGPIISGPVFASNAFKSVLKKIDRKVLAIETESSGMCRAANKHKIPCVTVRGISDHADINKNALERTTKSPARQLAADNAISYFSLQLRNPTFMRIASTHQEDVGQKHLFDTKSSEPDHILLKATTCLDEYLDKMSPEYKNRPNNAILPIPRVLNDLIDDDFEDYNAKRPKIIAEALREQRNIFLRVPRSYPNQTLAWSIGQSLLKHEIDGKQILPFVISGDEIIPPNKGIIHAISLDPLSKSIKDHFSIAIIINEPQFSSHPKMGFLIQELKKCSDCLVLVISRSDSPTEQIDRLKNELGLVDHTVAPVPFYEIANYLETAFAMNAAEADTVASRLDETFSKFRLHTHPSYFIGLQETTLDALIQANQRAELIQLAVDGLLSFVVALDESPVKLSRTTREEFLASLAFEIRVSGKKFTRAELYGYASDFGVRKALEIQPEDFLRGYFSVGLLNVSNDIISFSVPFLEAYLLSERLRGDPISASKYFNPNSEEFDYFTFDLYVERGACDGVIDNICAFSKNVLDTCEDDENVYLTKRVKPRALSTPQMLLELAHQLSDATVTMAENSNSKEIRVEKQRLLDTRQTVRGKVASRDKKGDIELPEAVKLEFQRLDSLTRASTLLASVIGSGAERLDGNIKENIGDLILNVLERFLHYWTINRLNLNFDELREDLKSDATVEKIIAELGLYEEDRNTVVKDLIIFLDDQELRLLSGPGAVLFNRLSQYAGVRSLRPILSRLKPKGTIQRLFRDVWLMDVEHNDGRKALKDSLQKYKGSPLLRLVVTNHLMNRIFWYHWQRESKASFVDVARYSLAPLGLKPADEHTQRALRGPDKILPH